MDNMMTHCMRGAPLTRSRPRRTACARCRPAHSRCDMSRWPPPRGKTGPQWTPGDRGPAPRAGHIPCLQHQKVNQIFANSTIIEVVRMTIIYLWQLVAWGGPGDTMPELRWPTWSEFISDLTSETIKQMMTFPFTEVGVFIWCEGGPGSRWD